MILTAGEIAEARADMETTLPDICGVITVTRTNVEGGTIEVESAPVNVACRVAPIGQSGSRSGSDVQLAAALGFKAEYVVTLPSGTDVSAHDRIVWNGATYEVNGPTQMRSEELVRRVYVVRGG